MSAQGARYPIRFVVLQVCIQSRCPNQVIPMKNPSAIPLLILLVFLCGDSAAQGDDCSDAVPVGTNEMFHFNNGLLSTSGFDGGGACLQPGLTQDGFWIWTAPAAGDYQFEVLGAIYDTGLKIYAGVDCMATCVAAAGPSFLGYTEVELLGVMAGAQYLVQAGAANGSDGDARLHVRLAGDPCVVNGPDGFEPNNSCAAAASLPVGLHVGLTVGNQDPDFYSVVVPPGKTLRLVETLDTRGVVGHTVWDAGCGNVLAFGFSNVNWFNGTGGSQTVVVESSLVPGAAFDCSQYELWVATDLDPCPAIPNDPFEPNDVCSEAIRLGDGVYANLQVSTTNKDHFAFCVAPGATVVCSLSQPPAAGDVDLFLRSRDSIRCGIGPGGDRLASSTGAGQPVSLSWTNGTGMDQDVVLEISILQVPGLPTCSPYDLSLSGSDTCVGSAGIAFCNPMDPNSSGRSTTLRGEFGFASSSGLTLEVTSGPAGDIGYFLVGNGFADPGVSLGQGRFCLGLGGAQIIGRYNVTGSRWNSIGIFNEGGVLVNFGGTSASGFGFDVPISLPIAGAPLISGGETWHFQAWHRDLGGQSNFSNGLSVLF